VITLRPRLPRRNATNSVDNESLLSANLQNLVSSCSNLLEFETENKFDGFRPGSIKVERDPTITIHEYRVRKP
jgi:hypothetical protein